MKRPGFTLVELLATMAILLVITVGVIIQFRSLSPTQTLENAADVLRAGFIEMRTAVVTSQTCCGGTLPAGYGLSMTLDGSPDNTIYYFADMDDDKLYTSSDTLLRTIVLTDVDVTKCETSAGDVVTAGTCTLQIQPGGFNGIYYNAARLDAGTVTVTLTHANGDSTTLTVYGQDYVIE